MSDKYENYKLLLHADYSAKRRIYRVRWKGLYDDEETVTIFHGFKSFYKFCFETKIHQPRYDFVAELLNCPCKGATAVQLRNEKIRVSSDVQKKYGLYDPDFASSIKAYSKALAITFSDERHFLSAVPQGSVADVMPDLTETESVVFYISDIHLDHKVARRFPDDFNEFELNAYFKEIAEGFKKDMQGCEHGVLFILGDVSFSHDLLLRFLHCLRKMLPEQIYFVLGNHEIWDASASGERALDDYINHLRVELKSRGIILLENDLAFPFKGDGSVIKPVYSETELFRMSDAEIKDLFRFSGVAFLGGMGFSGLNEALNADHGLYGTSVVDRKLEKERSVRFSTLHERLKSIVPENRQVVVATHMPVTDWSRQGMKKGWYYLSGHTHENRRKEEEGYHFLADNQVGYGGDALRLRFFPVTDAADIFQDRADGQYEISKDDYNLFYATLWLGGGTNREFEKIIMLKRDGSYMFFGITEAGLLYILDGGRIRSTCGHGLDYYYKRMSNYSASISSFLRDYSEKQKEISAEIRRLGGRGTIHGCIIDLDPPGTPFSYNHLYLNPLDGTLTAYFAETMVDKYVYHNVPSLLCVRLPEMYIKMGGLPSGGKALMPLEGCREISNATEFVINTDMYRMSRLIKSLQYTLTYKVIRIWNDAFADMVSVENGRLLLKGLSNPDLLSLPKAKPFRVHDDPKPKQPKQKRSPAKADSSSVSFADLKRKMVSNLKKECRVTSAGTTMIVAVGSHLNMEVRCKICGRSWNTSSHERRFICPFCHPVSKHK